ncbi:hypothetical protein V6N11_084234 [Hibiscus sabdariffa]|uniref:Uncharacterized protein n=1 Tax=Hibiscus sabdariffa TaxID=183260 RepID=A0ABR2QSP3_9ROSI
MLMVVTISWINRLKVEGAQWRFGNGQVGCLKGRLVVEEKKAGGGGFGAVGYDLEASGVVEINGSNAGYEGWIE